MASRLSMCALVALMITGCGTIVQQPASSNAGTVPVAEVGTSQGATFHWRKVGGDPCNPRAGCTLVWALEQSGWPQDVRAMLVDAVRTKRPQEISITSGWEGWMTWGQTSRKFHPNTVADWPQGQREPTSLWFVDRGGVRYNLIKVHKCGNWGGNTSSPNQSTMTPGAIPVVACP